MILLNRGCHEFWDSLVFWDSSGTVMRRQSQAR